MKRLSINPHNPRPPTQEGSFPAEPTQTVPDSSKRVLGHGGANEASIKFIGNATTFITFSGARIMTDPNFLHAGDHVHLGPGVTATRIKNPAIELKDLPHVDVILLSHYHEDHFDREVEERLRRDIPIITTPHAHEHLTGSKPSGPFTAVTDLNFWESCFVDIAVSAEEHMELNKKPAMKVTGTPGKHVPPGPLSIANDLLGAVPPTNGWMVELGYVHEDSFSCGYRIYISGDTLMVDELKEIPEKYKDQKIDLMLIHLGGTTIPGPSMPLLMVTMDAKQGIELVQLIQPDITIPIHFDDYDVMLSPLEDFQKAMKDAGLEEKLVCLERGEEFSFTVK